MVQRYYGPEQLVYRFCLKTVFLRSFFYFHERFAMDRNGPHFTNLQKWFVSGLLRQRSGRVVLVRSDEYVALSLDSALFVVKIKQAQCFA